MPWFLDWAGAVLGFASSALGFVSFFRDKIQHRTWFIVGAILVGGMAVTMGFYVQAQRHEEEVERIAERMLRDDAKIVSDAILITGWEDPGDLVGYLAQITGFYQRHGDRFRTELATYSRQLDEWQDHLRRLRESGATVYSTDVRGLRGLVTAGDDNLERIASGQE